LVIDAVNISQMDDPFNPSIIKQQVLKKCREDMAKVAKLTEIAKSDAKNACQSAEEVADTERANKLACYVWSEAAQRVFPIWEYQSTAHMAYCHACGVYNYAKKAIHCGDEVEAAVRSIIRVEKSDSVITARRTAADMKRDIKVVMAEEWVDYFEGNNIHIKTGMVEEKKTLLEATIAEYNFFLSAQEDAKGKSDEPQKEAWALLVEAKRQAVSASQMAHSAAEDAKRSAMNAQKRSGTE
jgi:hypothetical protein